MNLYAKLCERAAQGRPLRIGLIGAGKFGSMYLAQVPKTPGVHLVGIADLAPANAHTNLQRVGWLAERYNGPTIAQLLRVYIARSHRRRGVARGLVTSARHFVASAGGYETIYLHTNASVPGAEAFWRAMPTTLVS